MKTLGSLENVKTLKMVEVSSTFSMVNDFAAKLLLKKRKRGAENTISQCVNPLKLDCKVLEQLEKQKSQTIPSLAFW